MDYHIDDFTEASYRDLLKAAKRRFTFLRFGEPESDGPVCLWRHDVDVSLQRALRLATLEAEEGIVATYFIHLHNSFYSALDRESRQIVASIAELGHDVGLHFDPAFYEEGPVGSSIDAHLESERRLIEEMSGVDIGVVSFHNPGVVPCEAIDADELIGMVNASGPGLRERFTYCSDSNGYWRFRRLRDVVDDPSVTKLYVLTHPGWWTPAVASPKERVLRAIFGRARAVARSYTSFLETHGRLDVGGELDRLAPIRKIDEELVGRLEALWSVGSEATVLLELWRSYVTAVRARCAEKIAERFGVDEVEANELLRSREIPARIPRAVAELFGDQDQELLASNRIAWERAALVCDAIISGSDPSTTRILDDGVNTLVEALVVLGTRNGASTPRVKADNEWHEFRRCLMGEE